MSVEPRRGKIYSLTKFRSHLTPRQVYRDRSERRFCMEQECRRCERRNHNFGEQYLATENISETSLAEGLNIEIYIISFHKYQILKSHFVLNMVL